MKIYIGRHSDSERVGIDYYMTRSYQDAIGWLREKAKGCSGNACQTLTLTSVVGTSQEVAIGLAKKFADITGVQLQSDPMLVNKDAAKDLNKQTREVKDGKVQKWRATE